MKVNIYKTHYSKVDAKKTVAAIIPNYNYEKFIIERIDSVLLQTYPVTELIILDDASTDASPELIEKKLQEIKVSHPGIRTQFIRNKSNSGGRVFSQWQKGVQACNSEYFWIAEADDSCDNRFLETTMEKLCGDIDIRLCFTDSCRINQDNVVKSKTCTDWSDMWRSGHWSKDYIANGKDEIVNYLSGQIFIMNVSSVVWKNESRLLSIFQEAEQYRIAGDWYIYSRVLEEGKIAYSAKPYNYYRKHDGGSASSVVDRLLEYDEVYAVQERMRKQYNLSQDAIKWQRIRRNGMGFMENEDNINHKGRIAWLVPRFMKGSGGHRTIFTNINALIKHGYACDMYVQPNQRENANQVYHRIVNDYGEFNGDVFCGFKLSKSRKYDMVIATGWDTAEPASKTNCNRKLYFIQDFEPWFFPMGYEYLMAENTYKLGLKGATIGRWLSHKMSTEYSMETNNFDFCADLSKYKPLKNSKKENSICLIFQPGKARRGDKVALKALQIVQSLRPKTKIYLYGTDSCTVYNLKATNLGVITVEKCNELYNKCAVGMCISASNPSRIPFEMMAAGLPVVEIYRENNIYDLPDTGCSLAEPSAEAIAAALIEILDDPKKQKTMSDAGIEYMKNRPIEKGYDQFIKIVDDYMSGKFKKGDKITRTYNKAPVKATEETESVIIKEPATFKYVPGVKEIARKTFSRRGIDKAKRVVKKAYHFIREA